MISTLILQAFFAAIGSLAFAILFHAPKSEYVYCCITGTVGWVIYTLILYYVTDSTVIASLIATFILTLLARIFATYRKNPVTIYLVTGIFSLVPGAGIYYSSYYLIMSDYANFTSTGPTTLKVALAIAIGIIFGLAIPQSFFRRLVSIVSPK